MNYCLIRWWIPRYIKACLEANAIIRIGWVQSSIRNGSFVDVRENGSGIVNERTVIFVGRGGIDDARAR